MRCYSYAQFGSGPPRGDPITLMSSGTHNDIYSYDDQQANTGSCIYLGLTFGAFLHLWTDLPCLRPPLPVELRPSHLAKSVMLLICCMVQWCRSNQSHAEGGCYCIVVRRLRVTLTKPPYTHTHTHSREPDKLQSSCTVTHVNLAWPHMTCTLTGSPFGFSVMEKTTFSPLAPFFKHNVLG